MLKIVVQKLVLTICALFLFASCSHYGHHEKCACSKDKKTCAHHQDGQSDKSDDECKDCKK